MSTLQPVLDAGFAPLASAPGRAPRRLTTLLLRPLISVALLAVLFWKVGGGAVWQSLLGADAGWVAGSALLVLAALAVSAWKWQVLLAAHGLRVPVRFLFLSYLVGQFFNNFLPSNIGGDVMRVRDVARYTGQGAAAASSVIGERLLAGLALALTAAGALLFRANLAPQVGTSIAVTLVVFGLLLSAVASGRTRHALARRLPGRVGITIGRVAHRMGEALGDRRAVAQVMALSFVFHATVVLLGWATFAAVGAPVPLATCFLFIPIIMAIQLAPISLNGLGVREGAYLVFFGGLGLPHQQIVAASLLFGLVIAVVSLAGGVAFAVRK